jgi:glutaredoxin-like YruB-family protein
MNVKVYTAPGCAYCIIIENFLKRNNIKFKEIDISKDAKAKEEMKKKSGQESVPVTDVNGKIIVGYDIKKLKEALKIG